MLAAYLEPEMKTDPRKTAMLAMLVAPMLASCAHSSFQAKDTFTVNLQQRKPISPYIYGANSVDWDKLPVAITVNRLGGNRMTAYNWETNASNAGNDWHFQNDNYMGASTEPGWTLRTFLQATQAHHAAALITIPTAGRVSADEKGDGDVRQTPDFLNVRFVKSVAKKPGGDFAYPPEVGGTVYQDECVAWLEKIKAPTPPVWYILDNEPDIWASTHAEIVLHPVTYAGIVANNAQFAAAIKDVAPEALVFGPSSYGWGGYRTFQGAPDGNGRDFLEFYLTSMREAEAKAGRRLLDVLDIHWYPEARGGGVRICEGQDKPGTPEARIQAPRSLWDPTYVEDSWICDSMGKKPIMLLPRTMDQIAKCYPGTKLGINEYNYGGGKVISGAIAQADVLGLYGRYGVFTACNWGLSPDDTAMIAGYNAFLNFDGAGAKFGDQELTVGGETASRNSLYAALDSAHRGRITLVAINKTDQPDPVRVTIAGLASRKVRAFAVTSEWLHQPRQVDADIDSGAVTFIVPPLSIVSAEVIR